MKRACTKLNANTEGHFVRMNENLSYQEKLSLLSILNSLLILGIYALIIYNRYVVPDPEIIYDMKFWGKAFLILIPVAVVVQIVMHILFHIVNRIITLEDPPEKADEMDKLIELKSIRVSHWVFIVGFFSAMGSQAIGMAPWVMFVSLISSGFLAGILSDLAKVWYYRQGV